MRKRRFIDVNIVEMRARWQQGESLAALCLEAGLSRTQLWKRMGSPAALPVASVAESALGVEVPEPGIAFVAWAAGFFDGEGCITAGFEDAPTGLRSHLLIVVGQAVPEPLVAMQQRWGGSLKDQPARNPRHRHQWRWTLIGRNAEPFLTDVLPYLRVKHHVARLALEYITLVHLDRRRVTEADQALRRPIIQAIRAHNRPFREEMAS